jgi:putative transposase
MLEYDSFYHIYNQGNNHEDLFRCDANYRHFLKLYEKYISPIAETFAWGLMINHFHVLVRIKEEAEILPFSPYLNSGRKPTPSRQFAHLFNAYAQSFNRTFSRTGCLFKTPFQRIKLNSLDYIVNLVLYIHNNPAHHKINYPRCKQMGY